MTSAELVNLLLETEEPVNPAFTGKMPVICQCCDKHYKDKPCLPEEATGEPSHGICPDCFPKYMERLQRQLSAMYGKKIPLPATAA
jgi:hypothetical protein